MPRIVSLDLARGFAVLFIVPIHIVLLYSQPEVLDSWLSYPLLFIAEGIGPQIFLVPMGIFIALKPDLPFKQVLKRAGILLIAGYALNIFKFLIPRLLVGLPPDLEQALAIDAGWKGYVQLLAIGDILHFAALALPICYFLIRRSRPVGYIAGSVILFTFGAPLFWDGGPGWLKLLTGHPPETFFAWVDWMVYPLVGLLTGISIRTNLHRTFTRLALIGPSLMMLGWAIQEAFPKTTPYGMYRSYPGDTIFHIGLVLLTLSFWHLLERQLTPNCFFQLLRYSSRHITWIYGISWILITGLLSVAGYQQNAVAPTLGWIAIITALTYFITGCFTRPKN